MKAFLLYFVIPSFDHKHSKGISRKIHLDAKSYIFSHLPCDCVPVKLNSLSYSISYEYENILIIILNGKSWNMNPHNQLINDIISRIEIRFSFSYGEIVIIDEPHTFHKSSLMILFTNESNKIIILSQIHNTQHFFPCP